MPRSPTLQRAVQLALQLAAVALIAGGCRTRGRGGKSHPPASVWVGGSVDARATELARAIDGKLGGRCPRAMRFVTLPAGAREAAADIARRCLAGAPPSLFSRGLVELLAIEASADEAAATTLRTLAHGKFADGLGPDLALRTGADDDSDDDAVAYAVVAHLAARPGVGERGVFGVALALAHVPLDVALERPPIRTDFDTLFSAARADTLEQPLPRGPHATSFELRDEGGTLVVVVELDRPVRDEPRHASICGVPSIGAFVDATHDTLRFVAPECPANDDEPVFVVEIGGTAASPRGLDGAIVPHTYGRALPVSP